MKICDRSNSAYIPLKFTDDSDNSYNVYTISTKALPSHIRSILPASENHMVEYMALEKARVRLRNVIIALTVFAVSVALLTFSLVIAFQENTASETSVNDQVNGRPVISWQKTNVVLQNINITTESQNHESKAASIIKQKPEIVARIESKRSKCVGECWAYAAFRFRSTCDNGYCTCNGHHYDHLTCLPSFNGCLVTKDYEVNVVAKMHGVKQNIYGCRRTKRKNTTNFHILSIFGNHRASTTEVRVTGNTSSPAVLVLVNYHPVTWKVTSKQSTAIKKVVLVSYNHLSNSNILLTDIKMGDEPEVARMISQTGYGEDKFGGHTPELLENIQRTVGTFETFSGTPHADYWEINLDDPF